MTRAPPLGKTTSRLGYTAAVLVLCTWLIAMGHASGPGEPWQARFGQDHPLIGQIWDVEPARFIDTTTLVQRLTNGRFVLLGEKHDNPDHHRLQAWILRAVLDASRRPAVGYGPAPRPLVRPGEASVRGSVNLRSLAAFLPRPA